MLADKAGERIVGAGYGNNKKGKKKQQKGFLMRAHPLSNFHIQNCMDIFVLDLLILCLQEKS